MTTEPTTSAEWDPWAELARREHIELLFDPVAEEAGGAFVAVRGPRTFIVLSPRLAPWARAEALTHELIHEERGLPEGGADDLEEAVVRRLTAGRMAFYVGELESVRPCGHDGSDEGVEGASKGTG
jgi:hypothetical protein